MTGSIKTKTPKFKFIIPQFNIATWHDYIEDNFRAIDALFYNIFDIQNYKGSWTKTTEYKKDQVLFIPEDYEVDENGQFKTDEHGNLISSQYSGRMVKVIIDHTTNNSDYFSQFYYNHKNLYELFADASNSQEFAQRAENYAKTSKQYRDLSAQLAQTCINAKQSCENEVNKAKQEVTNATNQANLSKQYADNAKMSENNAAISKNNAKTSETNATNQANLAQQYKDEAKEWAVSQNIVDNKDYSSKYWAVKSKEWAESVSSPVNKNLSNLNPQGQNIANWSTNISNCITEISQDIKLELNNGTLILKTGSKLYVPNSAGVFNIITMNVDAILGQLWNLNNQVFVVYTPALGTLNLRTPADCSSGSTDSLSGRFHFWYDTTNNLIKAVEASGTIRAEYMSFPLALVTMIGDGTARVKSIDQVFNGFGYIGSTVFILPGVKGLIANGRNEDGSLNNIVWTNRIVRTRTYSAATTALDIRSDGWFGDIAPVYDEEENLLTTDGTDRWMNAGVISSESTGRITSFTPKTAFHAVDLNDSSWLSGLGMPSSRYIDLTLGASGSTYTAPANGWFHLQKVSGVANAIVNMYNQKVGYSSFGISVTSGNNTLMSLNVYLPVKKGDSVYISYNATGETKYFTFNYAEGED